MVGVHKNGHSLIDELIDNYSGQKGLDPFIIINYMKEK